MDNFIQVIDGYEAIHGMITSVLEVRKFPKEKNKNLQKRVLFLDFYRWIARNATELPFED